VTPYPYLHLRAQYGCWNGNVSKRIELGKSEIQYILNGNKTLQNMLHLLLCFSSF